MIKSRNKRFVPYTLTPRLLSLMTISSDKLLNLKLNNPKLLVKDDVLQIRAHNYYICQACKGTLQVNDVIFRYGSKPHFCHVKCENSLFISSDSHKESSISPSAMDVGEVGYD
jgi:hypothetical protein